MKINRNFTLMQGTCPMLSALCRARQPALELGDRGHHGGAGQDANHQCAGRNQNAPLGTARAFSGLKNSPSQANAQGHVQLGATLNLRGVPCVLDHRLLQE